MSETAGAIEIVPYSDEHRGDFRRLNLEWLDGYGLTETCDLEMLDDPRASVLAKGGRIFLALDGAAVIGTAALLKGGNGALELAKMSVAPSHQGRGIGNRLLGRCLEEARKLGARKVVLFSSTKLAAALKLYEKHGFRRVPVTGAPFVTADVRMELDLAK